MPTNWWGSLNAVPLKFDPNPSVAAFSAVLRSEVAGDVISCVAVGYVGLDVRATFGESGLNSG